MWVASYQVVMANKKRSISFVKPTLRYERECLYSGEKKNWLTSWGSVAATS